MAQSHTFLLLLLLEVSSFLVSTSLCAPNPEPKPKPDTKYITFVKTACNTTTYPVLCQTTCIPFASYINGDLRRLTTTALLATLSATKTASRAVVELQKSGNLTKYDKNVIQDCIENMGDTIDDITQSVDEIKDLGSSSSSNEMKFKISNIETWMSAAITNESTCMDEIEDKKVSSYVKTKIRAKVLTVAKLTTNALSLCNRL